MQAGLCSLKGCLSPTGRQLLLGCAPEPEAAKAEGVCAVSSTTASRVVICMILFCIRCCFLLLKDSGSC